MNPPREINALRVGIGNEQSVARPFNLVFFRGGAAEQTREEIRARRKTVENGRSNSVRTLARDLFYSETPLSAAQAEQFIDAIAAVARTPRGMIDLGAVEPEALFAQASTVLSEPQLAAFKQHELRRRQLTANHPPR
jgi:hypothetical protein